jgi:hypothetical protein
MSTLLETAARSYQLIVPRNLLERPRAERECRYPRHKIEVWLRDEVVPAIEGLWARARFQEQATHPIRAFRVGEKTPEWRCVDAVARAMQDSARAVLALAQVAAKQGKLLSLKSARQALERPGSQPVPPGNTSAEELDLALALCQTEALQKRKAAELVNAKDYFGPSKDAAVIIEGRAVTNGMFVPLFNAELGHVGNHVVRCLLTRIKQERDAVRHVQRATYAVIDGRRLTKTVAQEQQTSAALADTVAVLERELVTSPEARLREACIVLTQVYRDCAQPAPDVAWLGLSERAQNDRRGHIRHFLISGSDYVLVQRIAKALDEARDLYQDTPPDQSAIEEAIATRGLILVEHTREAFWEGEQVMVDWNKHRASWEMLWKLVTRARSGQYILPKHLYPDDPGKPPSTMASRSARLKRLLPASLLKRIVPGPEPSSYRLQLDAHLLHAFRRVEEPKTDDNHEVKHASAKEQAVLRHNTSGGI